MHLSLMCWCLWDPCPRRLKSSYCFLTKPDAPHERLCILDVARNLQSNNPSRCRNELNRVKLILQHRPSCWKNQHQNPLSDCTWYCEAPGHKCGSGSPPPSNSAQNWYTPVFTPGHYKILLKWGCSRRTSLMNTLVDFITCFTAHSHILLPDY